LQCKGYRPRFIVGIVTAVLLCCAAVLQGRVAFDMTGGALAASVLIALIAELPPRDRKGSLEGWALTFASACYVGWLLSHYILLRRLETPLTAGWLAGLHIQSGAAWVYVVLAITWMQDTMAYFVGRTWGRHKMTPYLSPKKSWEGAVGGLIASILTAMLAVPMLGLPIGYAAAALLGVVGGLAGLGGDLAVSLIKRQINIKDIGTLIPGHGGILDRLDSMLFTAPVLYYMIFLLTTPSQSSTLSL
jgi:phosphatidate cytidylyltransferase